MAEIVIPAREDCILSASQSGLRSEPGGSRRRNTRLRPSFEAWAVESGQSRESNGWSRPDTRAEGLKIGGDSRGPIQRGY